jgi:hypothetical protein
MKRISLIILLLLPLVCSAQIGGEKFRRGYIVDTSGGRYEGLIKLEAGDEKNPSTIVFKEDKKGKKENYGTSYVKAFKIESDSFTVLKNIPMPKKKVRKVDFAKVVLRGSGGAIYLLEYTSEKDAGHASSEFTITEEYSRHYIQINGKLAMLTPSNFKDVAVIVGDCPDLKARIAAKKLKPADLAKVVAEYEQCKTPK